MTHRGQDWMVFEPIREGMLTSSAMMGAGANIRKVTKSFFPLLKTDVIENENE
jgi:hypothetical protein